MRLAALAARLPALADGLPLPASLGTRRVRSGAPLVQAPLQTGRRAPHPRPGRPGAGGPGGVALGGDPRQPDGPDGRSKGGCKGYDAGKRLHGRKRHILTDTDGRLRAVELHGADVQDRDGAKGVLKRSRRRFPFVERVFAGKLVSWASDKTHVVLEIVRRRPLDERFRRPAPALGGGAHFRIGS